MGHTIDWATLPHLSEYVHQLTHNLFNTHSAYDGSIISPQLAAPHPLAPQIHPFAVDHYAEETRQC